MSSHAPHSHTACTAVGFSIGFVGIVGLVVSLIALIPLNVYNISLTIVTLTALVEEYGQGTVLLPPPYRPIQIFLAGSLAFSVITIILLLATCWRNASRNDSHSRQRRSRGKRVGRRGSKASSVAESERSMSVSEDAEGQSWLLKTSFIGRLTTLMFIAQFCWAIFGSHLLYDTNSEQLPISPILRKQAMRSLLILWTNYAIMISFSLIFCFAACCILLGGISNDYDEEESLTDQNATEQTPLLIEAD